DLKQHHAPDLAGGERGAAAKFQRIAVELPGQLVALPTAPAARAPAGIAAAAAGTIPAATRFLGTRLIHLQGAAFDIHAVEFADGLGGVVSCSQLHKTKTARAPGFAVSNDASRGHLISFPNEKLLQALVRHAKRQIPNIEFCHTRFPFLTCKRENPIHFLLCTNKNVSSRDSWSQAIPQAETLALP